MNSRDLTFVNENFLSSSVPPEELDRLLAAGWRHFGQYFFRYSIAFHDGRYRMVMPLRIRLEDFLLTKSLRRIVRRNSDLDLVSRPIRLDPEKHGLFEIHKQRFRIGRPESLLHFLDRNASEVPCRGTEFCLYSPSGKLLAASFIDEAEQSVSAIYAMFDPAESRRSLGICTLLMEIEHAARTGRKFLYLGYAYEGGSFYDYKKRFPATERYDWKGNWKEFDGR